MTDIRIEAQYSTGAARQAIERALVAAGKDLGHLRPGDLALLEDFHTMGRIATAQLAGLVEITPADEVLDAGSGIGGTARYVAERSRWDPSRLAFARRRHPGRRRRPRAPVLLPCRTACAARGRAARTCHRCRS